MPFRLHPLRLRAAITAVLVTTVTALGADSTIEDRLDRLERELQTVRDENAALKAQLGLPKAGTTAPAVVRALGKETKLSLGGYAQFNAEFGDAPDARFDARDRFLVRRARFGLRGSWKEPVSFKLEADFGNNSIAGRSGYSAQITDAHVDYTFSPALAVRMGQFKTPFGYEQLMADTKLLTIERSLPNDRLTLSRQVGLGVSGAFAQERLSYSVGAFNGSGANNGFNDNDNMLFVARTAAGLVRTTVGAQKFTIDAGVNGYVSHDRGASFTGERDGFGVDVQAAYGPVLFTAELLEATLTPLVGAETRSVGWSVLAAWTLPVKAWQTVVRFESYEANTRASGTRSENLTFGLIYRLLGDDLRLGFNYILGDPAGPRSDQGRFLTSAQIIF